jgi:hypothetical protein
VNTNHAHVHELHSALSEPRESVARFVERRKTTGRRYDTKKGITARGLSSLPVRTFATLKVEAGREDRAADIRPASVSTARAVALSRLPDSAHQFGSQFDKKINNDDEFQITVPGERRVSHSVAPATARDVAS